MIWALPGCGTVMLRPHSCQERTITTMYILYIHMYCTYSIPVHISIHTVMVMLRTHSTTLRANHISLKYTLSNKRCQQQRLTTSIDELREIVWCDIAMAAVKP